MQGVDVPTAAIRRVSIANHWLDQFCLEESLSELPDEDLEGRCRVLNHVRGLIRNRLSRAAE